MPETRSYDEHAQAEPDQPVSRSVKSRWTNSANLDLLRTIAVSLVMIDHFGSLRLPFNHELLGRSGVLCFFVHTCLVLQASMKRHESSVDFPSLWGSFIARRVFRIYPLSLLALAMTLILVVRGHSHWPSTTVILSNCLLIQNLTHSPSILGPMWSLPFEMQMYLALPFLFLVTKSARATGAVIGIWVIGVAVATLEMVTSPHSLIFTFVPSFVPGVLAYVLGTKKPIVPSYALPLLLAALVASFCAFVRDDRSEVMLGWVFCLVLGAVLPFISEIKNGTLKRVFAVVATYSYGIYLFHLLYQNLVGRTSLPHALHAPVTLILTVVTSIATYHLIEKPFVKLGLKVSEAMLARRASRSRRLPI